MPRQRVTLKFDRPAWFITALGVLWWAWLIMTFFVGCAQQLPKPTFSTHVVALPEKTTRLAIMTDGHAWSGDGMRVEEVAAVRWFQTHGYTMLDRRILDALLKEQRRSLLGDDRTQLRPGRVQAAEQFIEVRTEMDYLAIQGVDVETGRILWGGTAVLLDYDVTMGGQYPHDLITRLVAPTLEAIFANGGRK